jgi:hypothetical protein
MDPVTAVALAAKAIAEMITEAMRGQTAEQRATMWAWYIKDVEWWRGLFTLPPKGKP